jgi:hypothetical protein
VTSASVPDILLPDQLRWKLRPAQLGPEHELLLAVLEDAVNCFQKQHHATDPTLRQLFLDARDWIASTDRSWLFSFENICDTLDLDPVYVRAGLRAWSEAHGGDDRVRPPVDARHEASEPPSPRRAGTPAVGAASA